MIAVLSCSGGSGSAADAGRLEAGPWQVGAPGWANRWRAPVRSAGRVGWLSGGELDCDGRSFSRRAGDGDGAVDAFDAIGEAGEPGAVPGVGAACAVVVDLEFQRSVAEAVRTVALVALACLTVLVSASAITK